MSELTATQESFIEMMKRSDELAIKGFQLLLQRNDYPKFFEPLEQAGFFAASANPAAVRGERENTVRIPYWPPLTYLKAVARHAGEHDEHDLAAKVMSVVRSVSNWRDEKGEPRRNYHTNQIFAEIIGLVPSFSVTVKDVDLIPEWLNDPYERMLIVAALDEGALPRFLDSTIPEDWAKATRVLYHVTAISWSKADDGEPTPNSVADDYFLGSLLKNHARRVGARSREQAAHVMTERVREVFNTPLRRDHSSAFRPAVEDDQQNYQWRSIENRVVEGLRDVVLGWAEHDPDNCRVTIQRMLTDTLQIIRRVGIYLVAQHWKTMNGLFTSVVGPGLFDNGNDHELYHLLQDHFAEMSPEQQALTVAAIDDLPKPGYGDDPERLRRHNQYRWLSAIRGKGYGPADQRYAELDADTTIGKLTDHPDFDTYISSRVGPGPTPYSPEELTALAKSQDLVETLNKFVPRNEWEGPTTDGLTSSIEAAARTNSDVFLDSLSQYLSAKPVYQHAVINGIKQAWEAKSDVNWSRGWEQLISFFEQLLEDNRFWQQTDDTYQRWVSAVIADFLHAGTQNDEHAYDATLLTRTQGILARLLEHEPGVETPSDDAMTWALNTTKGRVIEALFSQALRAARHSNRQRGTHQDVWDAIRPLFEAELEKCKNANYEFSTLCGAYLAQLQYLDLAWTGQHVDEVFPATYELNAVCALDGLAYASFTREIYDLLAKHEIIDRALRLDLKGRSAHERLVERIGAAYLWGIESLDSQRFTRLFENAVVGDLEILPRVFWTVRGNELAPDQRERILAFWDHSVIWAQQQAQVPSRFLSTLSLLATYISTIGTRERRLLEAVAPHVDVGHESYEFVAELLRLAPQDPSTIAKTLQLMFGARIPDYDYQGRIRALLELLVNHGQREAVILMSDQLRHIDGVKTLFKNLTHR